MNRDLGKTADGGNALFGAAKIKRALQTQGTQNLDIRLGEMAKMVGTKYLPPAHGAPVRCAIAPEVAEIAGAGEIEVAGRWGWRGGTLSHPLAAGENRKEDLLRG